MKIPKTMMALVKEQPAAGIAYREMPVKMPGAGEVLVEMGYAAVDGSDRHMYLWDGGQNPLAANTPYIQGHEGAGRVIAVGADVGGLGVGDRVAFESHIYEQESELAALGHENIAPTALLGIGTPGIFAPYATVPAYICHVLPETIPFKVGAVFEPSAIGLHALRVVKNFIRYVPAAPRQILVLGATSIIGATAALAAKYDGFEAVAVGRDDAKLAALRQADPGLDVRNSRRDDWADGRYSLIIESSGNPAVFGLLPDLIAPMGLVVEIGLFGDNLKGCHKVLNHFVRREVTLKGISGRAIADWERLTELVAAAKLNLEPLITDIFTLDQFETALGEKTGVKSVFRLKGD